MTDTDPMIPPPSFSGYWRVDHSKSDGMDPILTLMGVPWLVRRVADQLDVATVIIHDSTSGLVSTSEKTSVGVVSENKMVADGVFVEKKGSDGRFAKVRCTVSSPQELLRDVTDRKEGRLHSATTAIREGGTQNEGKEEEQEKKKVSSSSIEGSEIGNGYLEGAAEPGAFTIEECLEFCKHNNNNNNSNTESGGAEGVMRIVTVLPENLGTTDNAWVLLRGRARMVQRLAFTRDGQTVRIRRELFNTEAPDADTLADIVAKEKTASARKKGRNEEGNSRRTSLVAAGEGDGERPRSVRTSNIIGTHAEEEDVNEEAHALREAQSAYSLLVGGSASTTSTTSKGVGVISSETTAGGGGGRVDGNTLLRAAIGFFGGSVAWSEPDTTPSIDPFFVSISGMWVTQSHNPNESLPSSTPPLTPVATPSSTKKPTSSSSTASSVKATNRLSTLKRLWKANAASSFIPATIIQLLEATNLSIEHSHELCVLSLPSTSPSSSSTSSSVSSLTPRIVLPLDGQWRPERISSGNHQRWVLMRATHLVGSRDRGPAWVGHEFETNINHRVGMVPRVFLSGDEEEEEEEGGGVKNEEKKMTDNAVANPSTTDANPMTADPYLPFFSCLDFNASLYSSSEVLVEILLADVGLQVRDATVRFAKSASATMATPLTRLSTASTSTTTTAGARDGKNLKSSPAVIAAIAAGLEPWQALPWDGTVPRDSSKLQLRFNFSSSSSSSSLFHQTTGSGTSVLLSESITFLPSISSSFESKFTTRAEENTGEEASNDSPRSATFSMVLSSPGLQSVRALEEKKRIQHVRAKLLTRRADADRLRKTYFLAKVDSR